MKRAELNESEIRQEYLNPNRKVKDQIARAIRQQSWIKMHSEVHFEASFDEPYNALIAMMRQQLPNDKFNNALSLLRFPLPSTSVVDTIFDDLSDIFTGRNPVYAYQFRDPKCSEDWEWYRANRLGEPNVWSSKAWEFFRTEINSLVVVDLPSEGEIDNGDPYPQPYFYFVPITSVVNYRFADDRQSFDWVMFKSHEGNLVVIDGGSYRTFAIGDGGELGQMLSSNAHGLGRCPARFFWSESISVTEPGVKRSPLSKVLSKLDWYVFSDINKRFNDIAGAYPIYWGYEEECDYQDAEGHVCDHGRLVGPDGKTAYDQHGNVMLCPECAKHRITGPGSFVRVPIPTTDQPSLGDPVGKLGVDKSSLEYNVEDIQRQKQDIIDSCIGKDSDIVQQASITDKQVDATYEKRSAVLERTKKGFESIQKFVDETICALRYGELFMQCSISYGTSFFTMSADSLRKLYQEAKSSGASRSELQALNEQIIQTEYRNNPLLLERLKILQQVEPFVGLSVGEVLNFCEKGLCDTVTFELKSNFENYISKFERENGNITEFGIMMDSAKRVDTISNTLYEYAKQSIDNRPDSGISTRNVQEPGE